MPESDSARARPGLQDMEIESQRNDAETIV